MLLRNDFCLLDFLYRLRTVIIRLTDPGIDHTVGKAVRKTIIQISLRQISKLAGKDPGLHTDAAQTQKGQKGKHREDQSLQPCRLFLPSGKLFKQVHQSHDQAYQCNHHEHDMPPFQVFSGYGQCILCQTQISRIKRRDPTAQKHSIRSA